MRAYDPASRPPPSDAPPADHMAFIRDELIRMLRVPQLVDRLAQLLRWRPRRRSR